MFCDSDSVSVISMHFYQMELLSGVCKYHRKVILIHMLFLISNFMIHEAQYVPPTYTRKDESLKHINWVPPKPQKEKFWGSDGMNWVFI